MINVAVVGAGYWGKNLLRNFNELGALYAICESDPGNSNLTPYTGAKLYTEYRNLLSDKKVQAVAISAPAVMHYEMVKNALDVGKDVYVEKPLALTVKEGEELVMLAENKNRILMVGHILQYHPAVIKLKELISTGQLGKIQYIYSNRLNIGKLRTEENILWSFAPHDISVILALLGEEPQHVSAFGGDYLNRGIYDTTLTTLDFRNGVKAHIFVSWIHPYKEQKLIVVGSRAMAVFDDVSNEKLFMYPHRIEWKDGKIPIAQKADYQVIPIEPGEPLKNELSHFIQCVTERKRPQTDGAEGLRVLRALEAAEKSVSESKRNEPAIPPFNRSTLQPYFVHESAYVDDGAEIGAGTKVWFFSHILKGSRVGKNCIISQNVMIGPDAEVGNRCKIQNNVSVYTGVKLEDEVFCGPSCVFTNVYNPRAFIERKHEFKQTLVKRGATIGANATIVCGITVGRYAMIGAGAVVKRDVPDHAIVAGVPAKQVGWACKCGTTLKFNNEHALCAYCGNEYQLNDGILTTDEYQ
ncbi:oxidoreductase [Candidatus Brocadia sapporoensis]|uniref:Oxidoreductase n=1 Tax=Candidatus Brocadia sapporoensis TaxID=392547 RepID=A0A1V6M1C9_9BACT|nr:Gfo/Idh/MocA family oxidoreductase [Candidatus Brocadia sapporoensis]MDG6006482.1 oxidoreductase [Candidatus Brocadia sp.]OQD46208.1 oxidoreductase [Candidatus Brocadia sapporoensis]GJQ23497.1 MAG: oxidoreductase [Candidatus Brocadia sapporoensis]